MRFFTVLILASVCGSGLHAQDQTTDLQVKERLGETIAIDTLLRDENAKEVILSRLIDKPTLLTLNYFACAGICTPMLVGVAEAVDKMGLQAGKDFQIITVSFDDKDTPDIARQKRDNFIKLIGKPLPQDAWRFLTGTSTETKALADSVGFPFLPNGLEYIHPGVIMMLSPKGVVTRYLYGESYLPADLDMAVTEAAQEIPRPSIAKAFRFCFNYDPASRKYVFDLTRVTGIVILLLAAAFVAVITLKRKGKAS
ncbi:MAG: SCO family protein [Elusimicrobiota bacterium]